MLVGWHVSSPSRANQLPQSISLFPSLFIFEDPSQSIDNADDEHLINHLGTKRLYRTGGQGVFLYVEQTLGESTI